MRPATGTEAHLSSNLAELVCSNSLKSLEPISAPWLLKREMLRLGSQLIPAAFEARVAAGVNLSVDRALFSQAVERRIAAEPLIEVLRERIDEPGPDGIWIIATGPLTEGRLAKCLQGKLGQQHLYFYDAIAPIVTAESLDRGHCFEASRWGRGGADYINCPLDKVEYEALIAALGSGEKHLPHDFEQGKYFEGCLPVEELVRRGPETLRFGPLKPVGLTDPKTGKRPYACVQLRRENAAGSLYNLVGFQTQLKWGEQEKVLRLIPALKQAEFARFGSVHRNTYVNAPTHLEGGLRFRAEARIYFAGQITGVEGYTESAASGLLAGINAARQVQGKDFVVPPRNSMLGSLVHYLTASEPTHFQPVNAMWGLVEPLLVTGKKESKYQRYLKYRDRAKIEFEAWLAKHDLVAGSAQAFDEQAEQATREAEAKKEVSVS